MGERGSNKPVFTLYDFKILNALLSKHELKIGEIENRTNGTNYHIRQRINRLKEYGLLEENSRGGKAIFISIVQSKKSFVKKLLNFLKGGVI